MGLKCAAEGCSTQCQSYYFVCRDHWFRLPVAIQQAVFYNYVEGQIEGSPAWKRELEKCVAWIAVEEGRWTQAKADAWLSRVVADNPPRIWVTSVKQGQYAKVFTPGGPVDKPHPAASFVYVGRRLGEHQASVLGNPYRSATLTEEDDGDAISKYRGWLQGKLVPGGVEMDELLRILRLGVGERGVVLGCWCSPKRCHAQEIRAAVQALWGAGWR